MKTSVKILAVMVLVAGLFGIEATAAHARLAANRLAANRLAANQLAANQLAATRLASNQLVVNAKGAADLLATEDGREVLRYLVSCALPADITLVATVAGTTYEFPGNLGLAPEWLQKRLSKEGQGWISACLLARVNQHDTAEEISLRGEHPALTISLDEALLYSVEEGAFYGNLFNAKKGIIAIACRGRGQAAGEGGGLALRDCAEPDPNNPQLTQCGFTFAGDCADFTPEFPSPYACEEFGAGDDDTLLADHGFFYSDCHQQASIGACTDSKEFRQVITTFVTP